MSDVDVLSSVVSFAPLTRNNNKNQSKTQAWQLHISRGIMGAVVHHVVKTTLRYCTLNYNPQALSRVAEVVPDVIWCLSSACRFFPHRMWKYGEPLVFQQSCEYRPMEMSVAGERWGKQRLAGVTAKRMCAEWDRAVWPLLISCCAVFLFETVHLIVYYESHPDVCTVTALFMPLSVISMQLYARPGYAQYGCFFSADKKNCL